MNFSDCVNEITMRKFAKAKEIKGEMQCCLSTVYTVINGHRVSPMTAKVMMKSCTKLLRKKRSEYINQIKMIDQCFENLKAAYIDEYTNEESEGTENEGNFD